MKEIKRMLKNNFFLFFKFVFLCMLLFFVFDAISVLLASLIVYFKADFFQFNWKDIFISFFRAGYVGGVIAGIGLYIKVKLQERKKRDMCVK